MSYFVTPYPEDYNALIGKTSSTEVLKKASFFQTSLF